MKKQYSNPTVAVVNLLSQSVLQSGSGLGVGGNKTDGGVVSDAPARRNTLITGPMF